jgi:hypothetical protein
MKKDITPINTILVNLTDKIGYNEQDQTHIFAYHEAMEAIITYLRSLKHTGDNPTGDTKLEGYYEGYNQALKDIEEVL